MRWIYGLQEALKKAGSSADDANTAFKAVAASLDEMQRGGDSVALKKLLDAPGNQSFLKGFNRDAATAEETMTRVLKIIGEMPNMIQAVDVAKNLGIPASVAVAAFKEGGDAIAATAAASAKAAPDLEQIANSAKMFDSYMQSAITAIKAWVTDNAWLAVKDTISEIVKLLSLFQGSAFKGGPLENFGAGAVKNLDELQTRMNQFGPPAPPPTRVKITGGTAEDPYAHKDTAAAGADAYERETKAIDKQIAVLQAQAATVGESAYAQEEYRVQLILTEKAVEQYGEVTSKVNDEIALQAQRAAEAKQALAEHTFALNRLNSASQQVGSALSTAFADAIVEGKSLNDVMTSMIKTLEKAAINSLVMSFFTPGAGGATSAFGSLFKFAGGTDFAPGGMALVGENGPELVNLPRGSQVIPNGVARTMGGGSGGSIIYSPAIDARGASVDAVARLAQIMEQDRASFASRTVATIQQARRGRVPGL